MVNIKDKNIEDFRVYSQKMELLVSLANDVAHSFNDILQTIKGNLELAIVETKEDSKQYNYLIEAYETLKQGSDLTARLEIIGKKFNPVLVKIDLKKELERIKPILRRNLPERIELVINISEDTSPINIDPFQLEQLFLHMVLNASDAIKDEGTFSIDIENSGSCVKIEISDDGSGMPEEIKAHVFEPFFTTKSIDSSRMGLSAGLGLYIVERIVLGNNGAIRVDSRLGEGTTFIVNIPAKKRNGTEYNNKETKLSVGNETILIIEDNDGVRNICEESLGKYGYSTISAPTCLDGIKAYLNNSKTIDLVLCDMVLPDGNGVSILNTIRDTTKEIKTIIMSGYDIAETNKKAINADGYLHKPFTINALLQAIRKVLD